MKTAIYIEDGIVQLVLTPESRFETNALRSFEEKQMEVKIFAGSFYDCQGGWVRQHCRPPTVGLYPGVDNEERSLIIRIAPTQPESKP